MGSKMVFYTINTTKSMPEVIEATKKSMMFMGGQVFPQGDGFIVKQGANGINFAFTANIEASLALRQTDTSKYELFGTINWSPNTIFWVTLIFGFFFIIPWIVPLLYLFLDPTQAYQLAFMRIQGFLD